MVTNNASFSTSFLRMQLVFVSHKGKKNRMAFYPYKLAMEN